MRLQSMIGYKFFKENKDSINMLRLVHVKKYKNGNPAQVTVKDEATGEIKKIDVKDLKGYTPLEPDGIITFNIAYIDDNKERIKDVIVTIIKFLNVKIGDKVPFAVCRQNITDIFYNLLCKDESEMIAGLSVNQNNCPTNFDFRKMLICDGIEYTDFINFYRMDTLEDIYSMIKESKFDNILKVNFETFSRANNIPEMLFKKHYKGWCSNLRTLLKENNFQSDINEMLGITDVGFDISKYIIVKTLPTDNSEYTSITKELQDWLCHIYKINIKEITVLKYGHDINLADFNNSRYFILRDNTNNLYLFVYTLDGEYHELDLQNKSDKKDFSTEFRINFYNKYNNIK